MGFKRPTRDHSKSETDNPTKAIHELYQELMKIPDPVELVREAKALARQAGGVSEMNLRKFERTLDANVSSLEKVQRYLTNFMLAGMGMSAS